MSFIMLYLALKNIAEIRIDTNCINGEIKCKILVCYFVVDVHECKCKICLIQMIYLSVNVNMLYTVDLLECKCKWCFIRLVDLHECKCKVCFTVIYQRVNYQMTNLSVHVKHVLYGWFILCDYQACFMRLIFLIVNVRYTL